jgi:hypothetical protein
MHINSVQSDAKRAAMGPCAIRCSETVLLEVAMAPFWASAFTNDSGPQENGDFGQLGVSEQPSKRRFGV